MLPRRRTGSSVVVPVRGAGRLARRAHCTSRRCRARGRAARLCVINDVVLIHVLFRFATDDMTDRVLARVQESGEAWMGGTIWDGRRAIRLSVSNWQTRDADIDRTVAAFRAAVAAEPAAGAGEAYSP